MAGNQHRCRSLASARLAAWIAVAAVVAISARGVSPVPDPPPRATPPEGVGDNRESTVESSVLVEIDAPIPLRGELRLELDDGTTVRAFPAAGPSMRLEGIAPGPYVIRAAFRGLSRVSRAIRVPTEEAVRLELRPAARIAGTVLDPAGQPADARVRLIGSGVWPGRFTVATQGRYAFDDVPTGVYEVEAVAPGLRSESRGGIDLETEPTAVVDLHLQPAGQLVVRVIDAASRAPIEGAELTITETGLAASPVRTVSGADGTVVVGEVRPGTVQVDVSATDAIPRRGIACETQRPCVLELERGARLAGIVLDSSGEPIEGAQVELISANPMVLDLGRDREALSWIPSSSPGQELASTLGGLGTTGDVPPIPLAATEAEPDPEPLAPSQSPRLASRFRTNHRGEFVITGVPPGHVEVLARAVGHQPSPPLSLAVTAGRDREDLELRLARAGRIEGRVVRPDGRIAEGWVEARFEHDPVPRTIRLDARGRFELDDVGGPTLVQALVEGHRVEESLVIPAPGMTTEVELTITADGPLVPVLVFDEGGNPVPEALVRSVRRDSLTEQIHVAVTDENGVASVRWSPGRVVWAEHAGLVPSLPAQLGRDRVSLALRRPTTATVRIVDAWTGEAVRGVEASLVCTGAELCHHRAVSDARGHARFQRVVPGRYRLVAVKDGFVRVEREVSITGPRGGEDVELAEVSLLAGLAIEGEVVDVLGRVTEGVTVTISGRSASTSAAGAFRIDGVPPGDHALHATHPSAGTQSVPVHIVRERDPAPVVVHLPGRADQAPMVAPPRRSALRVPIALRRVGEHVLIDRVETAAASRAGLLAGDVLVDIDGRPPPRDGLERWLEGPALIPARLRIRRGDAELSLRLERARLP